MDTTAINLGQPKLMLDIWVAVVSCETDKGYNMTLYIVIAYSSKGEPYVYADYDNHISASETANECGGIVRTLEV